MSVMLCERARHTSYFLHKEIQNRIEIQNSRSCSDSTFHINHSTLSLNFLFPRNRGKSYFYLPNIHQAFRTFLVKYLPIQRRFLFNPPLGCTQINVFTNLQGSVCLFILKGWLFIYLLLLERGEGREKEMERNVNVWLPSVHPLLGTWPATQVCALTGNQSSNPWFAGQHSIH